MLGFENQNLSTIPIEQANLAITAGRIVPPSGQ